MRAYQNGFWLFNTEPSKAASILSRDARSDGCCQFTIEMIYAACNNKGKEQEIADKCRKSARVKTAKEIELEEVLLEDFIW